MTTRGLIGLATTGAGAALLTVSLLAGHQTSRPVAGHDAAMPMNGTMKKNEMTTMARAQKIANAMTAAPSTISVKATVLDWPANEGGMPEVLRPGSNGWSCFPDMPESKGNDPMCVDGTWMKWIEAYFAHKTPEIGRVGIGYMLAAGGAWGSNTDPFAMKETPDNHWGHHNPHMMIVVPDPKPLAGLSTDPDNGGPYVMWAGTPYAHIMAPTIGTGTSMSSKH
jgi:hypothetical protein